MFYLSRPHPSNFLMGVSKKFYLVFCRMLCPKRFFSQLCKHSICFLWLFTSRKNIGFPWCYNTYSNGHIFVDSPSIRRRNSTWKVRGNYIDFERRNHVETMTSIRRGYFDVDLTLKIDEIAMNSPRGFFYAVSTSNRGNLCTRCFHSIIF